MTTQWIITAIILITALIYTFRRLAVYFRKSPRKKGGCEEFGGDCAACLKNR